MPPGRRGAGRAVPAAANGIRYVAHLVLATRPSESSPCELARGYVRYGAAPRGAQASILAAKVLALRDGRANVAFTDIHQVAGPALRHRLILSFEAVADGITSDQIIDQVLETVPPTHDL